jgi:hypothetical protein
MSKISARDIQMIFAGAFIFPALTSLIWLPHSLIYSRDAVFVFAAIFSCLALPLGIGILLGNMRALRLAQIFLWLCVIGSVINICLSVVRMYHVVSGPPHFSLYRSISDFLIDATLLSLLIWSRSRRFRHEPDA